MGAEGFSRAHLCVVATGQTYTKFGGFMLEQKGPRKGRKTNEIKAKSGRLGGLKGGKARAKSLSAKERSAIARKGAQARWEARWAKRLKAAMAYFEGATPDSLCPHGINAHAPGEKCENGESP